MEIVFKLGWFSLRFFSVLISSLFPKNKKIWIFSSWMGDQFSDNPKYLFLYMLENHPEIECYWITKNKNYKISNLEGKTIYAYSLRGIFLHLRAGICFYTHSINSDFNVCFLGWNTKRVQMWHGMPLKKIGYDDVLYTNRKKLTFTKCHVYKILNNEKLDLITASSDLCAKLFQTAFNEPIKKIAITGFARNDVFFNNDVNHHILTKKKKIIYMPTFRGEIGSSFNFFDKYGFDIEHMDKFCESQNLDFWIRAHPANIPTKEFTSKILESKNIFISNNTQDIYDIINDFDCLISDYSSILFDFALTGKKIILAPFDIEDYLSKDRQFYFPYDSLGSGNIIKNWAEFESLILNNDTSLNNIITFNKYYDGENSKRIVNICLKILDI